MHLINCLSGRRVRQVIRFRFSSLLDAKCFSRFSFVSSWFYRQHVAVVAVSNATKFIRTFLACFFSFLRRFGWVGVGHISGYVCRFISLGVKPKGPRFWRSLVAVRRAISVDLHRSDGVYRYPRVIFA